MGEAFLMGQGGTGAGVGAVITHGSLTGPLDFSEDWSNDVVTQTISSSQRL